MVEKEEMKSYIEKKTYHHYIANHRRFPVWKGLRVVKYPMDMISYAEIIFKHKPDVLIECGTKFGGSATFFADVMESVGNGRVITIDKGTCKFSFHPRIIQLQGSSTSKRILEQVKLMLSNASVMVSLDSDHHRVNVKRELHYYSKLVTKGQYLVVEDCFPPQANWANEAVDWFLTKNGNFKIVLVEEKYLYSTNTWLQRT